LAGRIVLSIGCDFKSDDALDLTDADKVRLDELHKRKIDLADEVLILNVGQYIGQSTNNELAYAMAHGKRVRFLEAPNCAVADHPWCRVVKLVNEPEPPEVKAELDAKQPAASPLDTIRTEIEGWTLIADMEDSPLGGNVVKAAQYRGTVAGLKMAEQIIITAERLT
jgi:hypothetical protein